MAVLVNEPAILPSRSTQLMVSVPTQRLPKTFVGLVPTTSMLPDVTLKFPIVPVLLRPSGTELKFSEKIIDAWPTVENADRLKVKTENSARDFTDPPIL